MNEHTGLTTSTPLDEGAVPQQVPLGASDFGSPGSPEPDFEDLAVGSAGNKKLNGGVVVLGAVVLIAVAGLFSMKKLAEATAAAAIDTEVETKVVEFLDKIKDGKTPEGTSAFDPGRERIVLAVLGESYSERQIPLRDLQRNPFRLDADNTIVTDPSLPPPDPGDDVQKRREWERQRLERIDQILKTGRELSLTGFMGGSKPLAIIGGETVRVGETVTMDDVSFRIVSIDKNSVSLAVDEPGFKISEQVLIHIER